MESQGNSLIISLIYITVSFLAPVPLDLSEEPILPSRLLLLTNTLVYKRELK